MAGAASFISLGKVDGARRDTPRFRHGFLERGTKIGLVHLQFLVVYSGDDAEAYLDRIFTYVSCSHQPGTHGTATHPSPHRPQ